MKQMLSAAATSLALAGSIFSVPARTQAGLKPNFSGQWVAEPSESSTQPTSPFSRPPICYQECVITHTTETLVVKDTLRTTDFKLDGSAVSANFTEPGRPPVTMTTTARWEGSVLVITRMTKEPKGKGVTSVARLSMSDGRLIIEGTRPHPDGSAVEYKAIYKLAKANQIDWIALQSK